MKLSSLLDNIKQSIASETSSSVNLSEKSFLSQLFSHENKNDGNPSLGIRPLWQYDSEKRFPLLRALLHLIYALFMAPVVIFYGIVSILYYAISRKREGKLCNNLKTLRTSIRLNAILFISMLVCYIVIILTIFIFFFNNVLLFNPNNSVNPQGAITIEQPCGIEHHIFLYNTASCWQNTGIEIVKGDKIEFNISGAFNGDIEEMNRCAQDNQKPEYPLYNNAYDIQSNQSISKEEATKNAIVLQNTIYNNPKDARFGSLLCHIHSEATNHTYDYKQNKTIHQIPNGRTHTFTAEESGYLHLATNDIYLSDSVWNTIKENPTLISSLLSSNPNSAKSQKDSLDLLIKRGYHHLWFDDNVGEMLVNVTVLHKRITPNENNPLAWMKEGYSHTYRFIEKDLFNNNWILHLILSVIGVFTLLIIDELIAWLLRKKKREKA